MCLLPEVPGQEDKEDEEAEEGWASSADGDGETRLADDSEPLTTSPPPPPSAGEQTNPWRIPNKLTLKKNAHSFAAHGADLFAEHVKDCEQRWLPRRFYISKSVRGVEGTITLHPLPEAPNCFQREEKTAGSGRDFGGATCEMRGDEKQQLINNAQTANPPSPLLL